MKLRYVLPLAAVALTAGSAAAQRPIVPGQITRGTLTASDPRLPDGSFYDAFVFSGRRGETVIVTMESGSFDTYLYLGTQRYGQFNEIQRDDDGGNGTNSRVEVRLPEDGTFIIRASSLAQRTGAYTLTLNGGLAVSDIEWVEAEPVEPVYGNPGSQGGYGGYTAGPGGGVLVAGQRISGRLATSDPTLDNGAYFHLYTYHGRRGERLTLTLRSTEFDAYLVIGARGGRHGIGTVLARDDDGAGGHDSRIVVTLPSDGEQVIRVNSLLPATGMYYLDVESSLGGGYAQRPQPTQPAYNPPYQPPYADDVVDQRLVGRWGLTTPGVRVDHGSWSSVSANAAMGILTIDEEGAYTWRKNGRVLRGQLVPFTPRRNARPGVAYYVINDGRDEFYVFFTEYRGERYMQVNGRATDVVVAYGYREGGSW